MKTNFNFIVLNAKRRKETEGIFKGFLATDFFNLDGILMATMSGGNKQIRKGSKFVTINCFKYQLNWL